MKKTDILGIAFGNFRRRKTRSILSVLGVVIGTASIVTMMSLGIAVNVTFEEQIKRYGNINQINVSPNYDEKTGKEIPLDAKAVESIKALENVKAVTPVVRLNGKVFCGKSTTYADIQGVDLDYLVAMGATVDQGRMLTNQDVSSSKNMYVLMGASAPYEFTVPKRRISSSGSVMMMMGSYNNTPDGYEVPEDGWAYGGQIYDKNGNIVGTYPPDLDVMDEKNRIRYTYDWSYGEHYPGQELSVTRRAPLYNVKTVGVLSREGGGDTSTIYMDLNSALKLKKEAEKWQNQGNQGNGGGGTAQKKTEVTYESILVLSDDIQNTISLTSDIKALGYQAYSSADWIGQQQETQKMLQMVLAGIGGVSLLVAAIGITNTMVMSIYERTREIGIMKVIGCYLKDIRTMFLTEAGIIGFFGGLFGVGLSYGVSALLNWAARNGDGNSILGMGGGGPDASLSIIPWWLSLLAIGFAIFVALVSGFFPARRAMRLSALEAMRN